MREHKLDVVLFNAPPGNSADGDRGLASLPGREHEFAAGDRQRAALRAGAALPARCTSWPACCPKTPTPTSASGALRTYMRNLRFACAEAAAGRT